MTTIFAQLVAICLAFVLVTLPVIFCVRKKIKQMKRTFHGIEDSSVADFRNSARSTKNSNSQRAEKEMPSYVELSPDKSGILRPANSRIHFSTTTNLHLSQKDPINLDPDNEDCCAFNVKDSTIIHLMPRSGSVCQSVSINDDIGHNVKLAESQIGSSTTEFAKPKSDFADDSVYPFVKAQKISESQIQKPTVRKSEKQNSAVSEGEKQRKIDRTLENRNFQKTVNQVEFGEGKNTSTLKNIHFEKVPPHQYELLPVLKSVKSASKKDTRNKVPAKKVRTHRDFIDCDTIRPVDYCDDHEYQLFFPKALNQHLSPSQ